MDHPRIRPAVPQDLAAVNSLLQQVLSVHHEGRPDLFHAIGKKYTDEELLAIFAHPETPVFVYEADGKVLGYAFCALEHKGSGSLRELTTLYIDDICTAPEAARRGVGAALFEEAKRIGRDNGCVRVDLNVWEFNKAAIKFYEKMGMKVSRMHMECGL